MEIAFRLFVVTLFALPIAAVAGQRSRAARMGVTAVLLIVLTAGAVVAGRGFWSGVAAVFDLSSYAPFPFALALDRLGAFFLLLICVVAAPATLFSGSYVERHYQGAARTWLWVFLPLFLGSMVLVVTASTAFAFLFGWELMTLFSAGLILVDGDSEERRHNLFIYLLMMHAGAAAIIAAFLLFLPGAPGLGFGAMRAAGLAMSPAMKNVLFLLAFLGFGAKAGIIPLHLWLPRAHPMAPSPVSALMSGVMLKTAIYGFVRISFDLLGGGPSWWGYVALAAGAISGVLGILYALAEHDLKRLLAYSSVENIGIIYMGLGAALIFVAHGSPVWAAIALMGALLHALNHAFFKSLLFLGAGAIGHSTHSLDIDELGGLQKLMPMSGAAFLVGCCGIVGLPLLNGFVSEWMIFRSFLAGSTLADPASVVLPMATGVLAMMGGLAAACFAKVYGIAFLGRARSAKAEHAAEVPFAMRIAMSVLAAFCVVIGVAPVIVLNPLAAAIQTIVPGVPLPQDQLQFAHILPWVALMVVALVLLTMFARSAARVTATWACGLPELDSRMQYTSAAFSKPLRTVFARVYRPTRVVEVTPAGETYFPTAISYRSARTTSYERLLYRPVLNIVIAGALALRRLQTGNIQTYLLYIFLALLALLFGMRFA